jgi:hypothetical protein
MTPSWFTPSFPINGYTPANSAKFKRRPEEDLFAELDVHNYGTTILSRTSSALCIAGCG